MRQYIEYQQNDARWNTQRLGSGDNSITIGIAGCYVTSMAILACYYGHTITPAQLDDDFTNKGLYDSGNLMNDNNLQKEFSDITFSEADNYANVPTDLGHLKQLMADPTLSVILELDFDHDPNDGIQTHFLVCNSFDGINLFVTDPWYGGTFNFAAHYGTNPAQTILKFVVYKGTPAVQQPTIGNAVATNYSDADKNSAIDRLVWAINNHDKINAPTLDSLDNTAHYLIDTLDARQKDLATLRDQHAALQGQYDTLNKETSDLQVKATSNDAVCDELGVDRAGGKDVEVAAVAKIKATLASQEITLNNLNKQLPALETENAQLTGKVETLTDKAGKYDELKPLYDQLESNYNQLQGAHGNLQQTTNRQIGQLKNSSYLTSATSALVKEVLTRIFRLK